MNEKLFKIIIALSCFLIGLSIGKYALADTTVTIPEFTIQVECEGDMDCPDCVPCPDVPTFPALSCPAGNYHGASHPDRAIQNGYESCMQCHSPDNPVLVGKDSVICTQYNPPSINTGRTIIDPVTNKPAKDPYSDWEIVGSNHLYILKAGDTVTCSNCHNPHRDGQDYFVEDERLIHPGCLDCHVRPGSDDIKGEDDDDDNGNGETRVTFVKEPWTRLCNDCHSNKNWRNDSHEEHEEEDVSCFTCHKSIGAAGGNAGEEVIPEEPEQPEFAKADMSTCNDCHKTKRWWKEGHKKHAEKRVACNECHRQ